MSDVFIKIKTDYDNSGIVKADKAIGGLLNSVLKGSAVIAAFGLAASKAFDFSQQGAQMLRLEKSGSSLAASYGANMNSMLSELKKASRGTIAETDLMLSANRAMMLGVTDDAEKMANLLEVAALRGRAMGLSTSQAFNDIVTGIGRMSPLILDNLGIVTGGEALYKSYAASLGLTADQLTDSEKKQALLNKVLADGNRLLEETSGLAFDTAEGYEKLGAQGADAYARLKKGAADFFGPAIAGAADVLEEHNKIADAMELVGAKVAYGGALIRDEQGKLSNAFQLSSGEIIDQNELLFRYNILLGAVSKTMGEGFIPNIIGGARAGKDLEAFLRAGEADLLAYGEAGHEAAAGIRDVAGETRTLFDLTPPNVGDKIQGYIDSLNFDMAGGNIFELMPEEIDAALGEGKITEAEAADLLSNLYVAWNAFQVGVGDLDASPAAQNISNTIGVSLADANGILTNMVTNFQNSNGMEVEWYVRMITQGGQGGGAPRNSANPGIPPAGFVPPYQGYATGGELEPSDGLIKMGEHGTEYMYWDPRKKKWVVLEHGKSTKLETKWGMAVGGYLGGGAPAYDGGTGGASSQSNLAYANRYSGLAISQYGFTRGYPNGRPGLVPAFGDPLQTSAVGGGESFGVGARSRSQEIPSSSVSQAAAVASQAATQAAAAAATGTGAAIASQSQEAATRSIAAFSQKNAEGDREQLAKLDEIAQAINKLPQKLAPEIAYELALRV